MNYLKIKAIERRAKEVGDYRVSGAVSAYLIRKFLKGPSDRGIRDGFFVRIETHEPFRNDSRPRKMDIVTLVYIHNMNREEYFNIPAPLIKRSVFRNLFATADFRDRQPHIRKKKAVKKNNQTSSVRDKNSKVEDDHGIWEELFEIVPSVEIKLAISEILRNQFASKILFEIEERVSAMA